MKVATGRRKRHKEWLRHYLKECEETPEKARLHQVLDRDGNGEISKKKAAE